ncbi:uncharacterized protein LOC132045978, partial [Lycium ferocissimum]|uniref:uncharacterized protein LOC132045978 n=1 Tax=Lycium ferocissimum TaxID=112874 RepID=UPI002815524A
KLKHIKKILSAWSKEVYGDIFKQLIIREEIVRIKEELFEGDPSPLNRMVLQQAQAELKKYLHFEEEFWRQKANVTWFAEGDRNTRFFHNLVNGRRKRLQIKRIQNSNGEWVEDLCSSGMFEEGNELLVAVPTADEVKQAIFALNGDSACGPDGLTGHTLPKSITHTNFVLLPKKQDVQTYADMRSISLSNFINKVISRVVHGRLEGILPRLVSPNQFGFLRGEALLRMFF